MVKVPKGYRSRNVQDRRGSGGSRRSGGFGFPTSSRGSSGGLGGGLGGALGGAVLGGAGAAGSRKKGCGGTGLILIVIVGFLLFSNLGGSGNGALDSAPATQSSSAEVEATFDLVNFVLDDVQDFWIDEFAEAGQTYPEATLIVFENDVRTGGCGTASSAVGPFYCPADSSAYIDLEYMLLLQRQLGAEGDFSQAYIVAHEIAHHVQNVLGTNAEVRQAQQNASRAESNDLSVRLELQADCLAGLWARDADQRGILDVGDIQEGINAAEAVGDDAITGSDNQENFTHGSSAQRATWFNAGFNSGDFGQCDTFNNDI